MRCREGLETIPRGGKTVPYIKIRGVILESDQNPQSHIRDHSYFVYFVVFGFGKAVRQPLDFSTPFSIDTDLGANGHAAGSLVHHQSDVYSGDHSTLRQGLLFFPVSAWRTTGFADRGIAKI